MHKRTKRLIHWTGGFFAVVVLLVATVFTLTPTIIRYFYADWLEQQGLNGAIGNINIQLGYGRVTLDDISIRRQDKQLLKLDRIIVQLRISDLADNRLTVETFDVSGLDMQVNQNNQQLSIAGIKLKNSEPGQATATDNHSTPWSIAINNVRLNKIKSCFYQTSTQPDHKLQVCQSFDTLIWKGAVSFQPGTKGEGRIAVKGKLGMDNVKLVDQTDNRIVSRLGKLRIENINIDSLDAIKVGTVSLNNYAALQDRADPASNRYAMQWQSLNIDQLSLARQQALSINAVQLTGLGGHIRVTKNKTLAPVDYLQSLTPASGTKPATKASAKAAAEPDKKPFTLDIKKVSLKTDKTTEIQDDSVRPAILHSVRSLDITINNINNSDKNNYSPLQADIGIGKYGEIKLSGKLQLFADKPSYLVNGKIKGIDLAELSPYSKELLQHHIQSGHLDTDLDIKIQRGQLDSRAVVHLHKFYVNKMDEKEQDKYQKNLGIPLSSALSLLRDREDKIKIELPVSGDMQNPDFSFNDIIGTVSAKAIKVAVINYYASFGLVAIAGKVFDLATALRFEPVMFQAAETALDSTDHAQLDKLVTMLNERPQVHLVLCGHVTQQDQVKLFPPPKERNQKTQQNPEEDSESGSGSSPESSPAALSDKQVEKLVAIARQRGENVKAYLVKKQGIDASRLILCNPVYEASQTEQPYVEIRI